MFGLAAPDSVEFSSTKTQRYSRIMRVPFLIGGKESVTVSIWDQKKGHTKHIIAKSRTKVFHWLKNHLNVPL